MSSSLTPHTVCQRGNGFSPKFSQMQAIAPQPSASGIWAPATKSTSRRTEDSTRFWATWQAAKGITRRQGTATARVEACCPIAWAVHLAMCTQACSLSTKPCASSSATPLLSPSFSTSHSPSCSQNVHNPYDVPPPSLVGNVNETYKAIVDYERRIYAGMLTALDIGVGNVTDAFKRAGLWDDTVFVFTTDNGGIGAGSNYPLRGQKVLNWEGGVKGAAFVRGTDTPVAPVPAGSVNTQLMHTTDWLPTLARLAGVDKEAMDKSPLPLDGHDQWDVIAHGAPTNRTFIAHNVPTGAKPVQLEDGSWTTSTCLSNVDNRTGPCHGFGMTGGALRKGSWKLLVTYPGKHPWGDSSPAGTPQILPGGRYPNGSHVFVPTTQNTVPQPYNNTLFLFDIDQDPTESHNLADTEAGKLDELLALYAELADRAVPVLSWIYGFRDPTSGHGEGGCTGPFVGSDYCAYGHEFDCWVQGTAITGYDVGHPPNPVDSPAACQQACAGSSNSGDDGDDIRSGACEFWSFDSVNNTCTFKSHVGHQTPSASTTYGPATCPHAT
eukprot:m.74920 g.74920  ORF g.74920 m.74920 type:complete len:551 (+) comp14460_c0_seq5:510-2162(+)